MKNHKKYVWNKKKVLDNAEMQQTLVGRSPK